MWPALCLTVLAGWSCLPLDVVSAQTGNKLYKKEGDQVVLKPDVSLRSPITKIVWRDGNNLATQWETDEDVIYYRHFKGKADLNISSGEMTITGLTRNFTAVYTPEINDQRGTLIDLRIISPVPVPTVAEVCSEMTCTLICEGNITGVEEVTYKWKSEDAELKSSSRTYSLQKEGSLEITEFSCELRNPVSQEISKPLPNPFANTAEPPPERSVNLNLGLTVLISLLTVVVVLALVHRCKAGEWFYEKESMPFEADFWRKEQGQRRNAAESNGIKDHQEHGYGDEETQMT